MIETALLSAFLFTFGWSCGRAHRDYQIAKRTVQGMEALVNSPWYGPQVLTARLHHEQDVVGDMPKVPVKIRFGPEEPRWWMTVVTNNRMAG